MQQSGKLNVHLGARGFARASVIDAVERAGLVEELERRGRGPFGQTSQTLGLLEALVDAADLGLATAEHLRGLMLEELGQGGASFALPRLQPEHHWLVATFQLIVTVDVLLRKTESLCPAPNVAGALENEGLRELLEADIAGGEMLRRVLRLARAYLMRAPRERDQTAVEAASARACDAVEPLLAFFLLLRRALLELAHAGPLRPLVRALESRQIEVGGYSYQGLEVRAPHQQPSGLLPVTVDEIVGNQDYLRAGLRLARDVAGYDFERRCNPKKFSPVLFGLGKPGCGKTVTAHAIGNAFLSDCEGKGVPAKFHVVRRTDWASSYQNASARNLVRFFREDVYDADVVSGIYWPDIDTAFASRDNSKLRQEEKQNLGAVFGIFDGTLLPRDGKWFLICDANTLHMDEATMSRIAQNPFRVEGPRDPADFIRLMRDILLKDVGAFLPASERGWSAIGRLAVELELSGRNVESLCGTIRAEVQDFDYPDEYFQASSEERAAIVAGLGHHLDAERLMSMMRDFAAFRRRAEAEAARARFDAEVERIVQHLNASRAAAERAECDEP